MTPPNIPRVYRWWHLCIEPAAALNGSRYLWFLPETYHEYMPITAAWSPKSKVIYDQLAACYMLFAFNQAITLRVVHDVFVWKVMLFGMALCDVLHMYSIWAEMGTREMLAPAHWRPGDWVTFVTTVGPFFLRMAFVLGVGLNGNKKERKSS